jgi:ABC-type molybdate transport system ATPase subunit
MRGHLLALDRSRSMEPMAIGRAILSNPTLFLLHEPS